MGGAEVIPAFTNSMKTKKWTVSVSFSNAETVYWSARSARAGAESAGLKSHVQGLGAGAVVPPEVPVVPEAPLGLVLPAGAVPVVVPAPPLLVTGTSGLV